MDVRFFMGWMLNNVFTSHNIYVMSREQNVLVEWLSKALVFAFRTFSHVTLARKYLGHI